MPRRALRPPSLRGNSSDGGSPGDEYAGSGNLTTTGRQRDLRGKLGDDLERPEGFFDVPHDKLPGDTYDGFGRGLPRKPRWPRG